MPNYTVKAINEKVSFALFMRKDGVGITGESPTLEIRRHTDGLYFDFNAGAAPYWVSTGGAKEMILVESTWQAGYYGWTFDQSVYDPDKVSGYTAIYRNPGTYLFVDVEIVSFELSGAIGGIAADVEIIRQSLINEQDLTENSPSDYLHEVYDDAGATGGIKVIEQTVKQIGNVEERRNTP